MFRFHKEPKNLAEGVCRAKETEGAVLLDVRTPEEYRGGHLPDSVNLPLDELDKISYGKETPLFVYCLSGARSAQATAQLKRMGYENVTNIGGISGYRGKVEK